MHAVVSLQVDSDHCRPRTKHFCAMRDPGMVHAMFNLDEHSLQHYDLNQLISRHSD